MSHTKLRIEKRIKLENDLIGIYQKFYALSYAMKQVHSQLRMNTEEMQVWFGLEHLMEDVQQELFALTKTFKEPLLQDESGKNQELESWANHRKE